MRRITVRVYGSLNDFVLPERRHVAWSYAFEGNASVKDVIEGFGVPHPEVDLILVNGQSVAFEYGVQDADRIAVFPRFEAIDISTVTRVRRYPPIPSASCSTPTSASSRGTCASPDSMPCTAVTLVTTSSLRLPAANGESC